MKTRRQRLQNLALLAVQVLQAQKAADLIHHPEAQQGQSINPDFNGLIQLERALDDPADEETKSKRVLETWPRAI